MKTVKPTELRKKITKALTESMKIPFACAETLIWAHNLLTLKPYYKIDAILLYAIAEAIKAQPEINARWFDEDDGGFPQPARIEQYEELNLGLAVRGKNGLVVVTIRDAEKKTLQEFNEIVLEFGKKAGMGKFALSDFDPKPVITLNNLGVFANFTGGHSVPQPWNTIMVSVYRIGEMPMKAFDGSTFYFTGMRAEVYFDHRLLDADAIDVFITNFQKSINKIPAPI